MTAAVDAEPNNERTPTPMQTRILYIFTRTPLHVGAGSSVGAIDQPIVRERHTSFPIVPASSLKGTFADAWSDALEPNESGSRRKRGTSDAAWLFGSDDAKNPTAGAIQFSEAKLLAFPVRSARGSFAWITCPMILRRATRDGVIKTEQVPPGAVADEQALFDTSGPLALGLGTTKDGPKQELKQIVLEEYTFASAGDLPKGLGAQLGDLRLGDEVWKGIASRLVILSDGMMSFFARNACEVAQHVRISDETGTAEGGALFNQENVPSETLFYALAHFFPGRGGTFKTKTAEEAEQELCKKVNSLTFQFGGDASTGLGFCTVHLDGAAKSA